MLEKMLVQYCAPTLGNLKTGNLFLYSFTNPFQFAQQLQLLRKRLSKKGISIFNLRQSQKDSLLYVCRLSRLKQDLQNPHTLDFLSQMGYQQTAPACCINCLIQKIQSQPSFPHEIGIFLGYPLSDVQGFIQNQGKNYLCCGCWKVYSNEKQAHESFAKYSKCMRIYMQLFESQTRTIDQLTVAA